MVFDVTCFFSVPPPRGPPTAAPQQAHQASLPAHHGVLLSGPPNCGKTSLLLQFAYNIAFRNPAAPVVFICNRAHLESHPPALSQEVDPRSQVFERIHFKYVTDDDQVRKYFAAFHLQAELPQAVIIHNLTDLFQDKQKRLQEVGLVKTLALCRSAIDYANGKVPPAASNCHLLVSETHVGGGPRFLYLLRRWLPVHCTLRPAGPASFFCSVSEDRGTAATDRAAYSKTPDLLRLDALHQPCDM